MADTVIQSCTVMVPALDTVATGPAVTGLGVSCLHASRAVSELVIGRILVYRILAIEICQFLLIKVHAVHLKPGCEIIFEWEYNPRIAELNKEMQCNCPESKTRTHHEHKRDGQTYLSRKLVRQLFH